MPPTDTATCPAGQTVVVHIAEELYGVDITAVQEIIRVPAITRVPNAPPHALGVTNIRGRIVPVMDLRALLGSAKREVTMAARVVVVNLASGGVGLWVDGVSEVLEVYADAVDPPSRLAWLKDADLLDGVVKLEDRLVGLLNLEQLLAGGEADQSKEEVA